MTRPRGPRTTRRPCTRLLAAASLAVTVGLIVAPASPAPALDAPGPVTVRLTALTPVVNFTKY